MITNKPYGLPWPLAPWEGPLGGPVRVIDMTGELFFVRCHLLLVTFPNISSTTN